MPFEACGPGGNCQSGSQTPPPTHTTMGRAGGCDPGANFCLGTRDLWSQNWELGSCPGSPGCRVPGFPPLPPLYVSDSNPGSAEAHLSPVSVTDSQSPDHGHCLLTSHSASPEHLTFCQEALASVKHQLHSSGGGEAGLLQGGAQGLTFIWVTNRSSRQHHNNGKPSII